MPQPEGASVKKTWYDEKTTFTDPSTIGFEAIDDLYIMATLNSGESLYVLFNAYARIADPSAGSWTFFRIYIDNNPIISAFTQIRADPTLTNTHCYSVALQYSKINMSAGIYNPHN